jgi:hypothetical protein
LGWFIGRQCATSAVGDESKAAEQTACGWQECDAPAPRELEDLLSIEKWPLVIAEPLYGHVRITAAARTQLPITIFQCSIFN